MMPAPLGRCGGRCAGAGLGVLPRPEAGRLVRSRPRSSTAGSGVGVICSGSNMPTLTPLQPLSIGLVVAPLLFLASAYFTRANRRRIVGALAGGRLRAPDLRLGREAGLVAITLPASHSSTCTGGGRTPWARRGRHGDPDPRTGTGSDRGRAGRAAAHPGRRLRMEGRCWHSMFRLAQ